MVERVVPVTEIPTSPSICRSALAVKRFGSGIAKYSRLDRMIARDRALGPDLQRARRPEEAIADVRFAAWRDRHRAVLEGDVAQIRAHGDRRRRADVGTRAPREVHAVVVESEAGYRRGVPPVEVEPLPIRVDGQRLEVAPVSYQVALYLADAAGSQGVCQLTQPREGIRIADAGGGGIGRVAAVSHRRVTSPVQHEVALNDSVHDGPAGVYAGPDLPVRWEKGGRDGRDDELGVARRDEETLGVSPVEQAPLVVHQRHAPELAVERWRVEPGIEPLGERLGAKPRRCCHQRQEHGPEENYSGPAVHRSRSARRFVSPRGFADGVPSLT